MKVLIINSSHRAGNTDQIILKVKAELESKGSTVKVLTLRDIEIKLPDGCPACAESDICPNVHDDFSTNIEPTLHNFDTYILATPVWSDGVTPLAKIFWDRIVSWCHPDRMYLKDKKLAVIVHGMAGDASNHFVIDWIKGVCTWEKAKFAGALTLKSGSQIGDVEILQDEVEKLVKKIIE